MAKIETVREPISRLPTTAEIEQREAQGWQLAAVEWQREVAGEATDPAAPATPYGLRVAGSGSTQLEAHPDERDVLQLTLDRVIDDENSLSDVATELNQLGYRTRSGAPWSQVSVFHLLPRVVEVAPEIFASPGWGERRKRRSLA